MIGSNNPSNDINIKLIRILIIIAELSYTSRKNPLLTLDKIAIFDFLVNHPHILHDILMREKKKVMFSLSEDDIDSIQTEFPDELSLNNFGSLRGVLKLLMIYEFIEITFKDNNVFYTITPKGDIFQRELDSIYITRVRILSKGLHPIKSKKPSELITLIKPGLGGANE